MSAWPWLVYLAAIAPCPAQEGKKPSRQDEIEELIGRSSPLRDDWGTEVLYKHADHRIKELGKVLEKHRVPRVDKGTTGENIVQFGQLPCRLIQRS